VYVVLHFICKCLTVTPDENLNGEDEIDDDMKEFIKPRRIGKRSINNMLEEWSKEQIIDEELIEAVNTKLSDRLKSSCQNVVERECSCR